MAPCLRCWEVSSDPLPVCRPYRLCPRWTSLSGQLCIAAFLCHDGPVLQQLYLWFLFKERDKSMCVFFYFLKVYLSVKSVSFDLVLMPKHATPAHPAFGYAQSRSGTICQVSFSSKYNHWTWIFHSMDSCSWGSSKAVWLLLGFQISWQKNRHAASANLNLCTEGHTPFLLFGSTSQLDVDKQMYHAFTLHCAVHSYQSLPNRVSSSVIQRLNSPASMYILVNMWACCHVPLWNFFSTLLSDLFISCHGYWICLWVSLTCCKRLSRHQDA